MIVASTSFTNSLSRVDPVSTDSVLDQINRPIAQTEDALNRLAGMISDQSCHSALIRHYAPLSADCFVGALVYYDRNSGKFSPAAAKLKAEPGSQGESVEAPCSRVEGMVLSIDSDVSTDTNILGTLLCGGYYESTECVVGCLGQQAGAGTYYLSPYRAGQATDNPGDKLRQGMLSYYGDGKFSLNLFYLAHDNHFHSSFTVTNGWKSASTVPDGTVAPVGANWWLDTAGIEGYAEMGEISTRSTAVFLDGKLQSDDSTLLISGGYLWSKAVSAPVSGSVVLFNHYPFAYGSPVVRDVVSADAGVSARNVNGIVTLSTNSFETVSGFPSATAVASLDGHKMTTTPIVSGIIPGPGIVVGKKGDGQVQLSSASLMGACMDAYDVNHNGTCMSSDGNFLYFTFPKSRMSSMVLSLPVNVDQSLRALKARLWCCCAGTGANFSVSMCYAGLPGTDAPVDMPGLSMASPFSVSGQPSKLSYAETGPLADVYGPGMLFAKIAVSAPPADDIRMLRIGFKITDN